MGLHRVFAITILFLAGVTYSRLVAKAAAPNVVIFFLDDWAWGDLGANGYGAETPHMDALAAKGMRFTDLHAMSVCTPSRASLLTGRLGLRTGVVVNFGEASLYGLPRTEETMGELAKRAGYDTKIIGKWHLGHAREFHPTFRGFDEYVGVPYSIDMGCVNSPSQNRPQDAPCDFDPVPDPTVGPPAIPLYDVRAVNCSGHVSCNDFIVQQPADLTSVADRYGDAAVDWVARHSTGTGASPFLLYMPFSHIHVPLAHAQRWTNKSKARTMFADTLLELDDTIGRVVAALDVHGVANNTLILLAGDNGPWDVKCALAGDKGPFTGAYQATALGGGSTGKFSTWEAGHRVAGMAVWPGRIAAGTVSNATVSTLDFVPTFASVAGVQLLADRVYDGVDLSPLLFDRSSNVRESLVHPDTDTGNITAVRWHNYKAYFETQSFESCTEPGTKRVVHNPPLVFDLTVDQSESIPVVPSAELLQTLRSVYNATWASVTGTFRSHTNYSSGGRTAWPCCDVNNVACRCVD